MARKDSSASLKETIRMLEIQQAEEGKILKEQLFETYESLKPANLLKSAFNEITSSLEVKHNLFNNLISTFTGYLTKKVVVGSSPNLFKKIAGILLQYGVSSLVSRYSETIRALGLEMIHHLQENKTDENIKKIVGNTK